MINSVGRHVDFRVEDCQIWNAISISMRSVSRRTVSSMRIQMEQVSTDGWTGTHENTAQTIESWMSGTSQKLFEI